MGLIGIQVDAFVDSTPAVSFYPKIGFRVVKTFEDEDVGREAEQVAPADG